MKKILSILLCMLLMLTMTACPGDDPANIIWTFENNVLTVSCENGNYPQHLWFQDEWEPFRDEIEKVVIGPGFDYIGDRAFKDATSLTDVEFSDAITSIGDYAFSGSGLVLNELPPNLSHIGEFAFEGCTLPQTLVIPNTVTHIGANAFAQNSGMEVLQILGDPSIRPRAFMESRDLIEVIPASHATGLGAETFANCKNLTTIHIPDTVTEIRGACFEGCESLASIQLPDSIQLIDTYAFANCTALTQIDLPEGLLEIRDMAFMDCTGLTQMHIPSTVEFIEEDAFLGCSSLTCFDASPDSSYVSSDDSGLLYDKAKTTLFLVPPGLTGSLTLPDHITSVGAGSFQGSGLTEVIVPDSVTEIQHGAFLYSAIRTVYLPESLTELGNNLFADCEALERICYAGTKEQWDAIENSAHTTEHFSEYLRFETPRPK